MIRLPAVLDNTDSKTKANNDNIQTTSLADTTTSTSLPVVTIESEYREVHVCLPESTACGRARMDRYSFNRNKNNIPIKYISERYDYFSWPMSLQNSDANANDKFMHHSDHNHLLDRWHDGTERKTRQAITHVSIFVKKVAHTRLHSVGFRSWSRFLAVSLQVTWIINLTVGCKLLPVRPAVTPATLKTAATNFAAWWTEAQWVWTVCIRLLPDSVATAIWTQALLRLSPAR